MSATPKTLGDYELLEELGRGGVGVVFRARHSVLGHEVALKKLLHGASLDDLIRFRREAKRLGSLQHPGIVAVRDVVLEGPGAPYLIMGLVEGESLAALVRREGPLPGARAARIVSHAARAIAAAHEAGIVHRDLKPSNLMVTPEDEVVVLDFGLARRLTHESLPATHSGEVVGTPSFVAPEQLAGQTGASVDVYGLAACLYVALSGRAPFVGGALSVFSAVANRAPEPPSRFASVPPWLEAICLRCLAKRPGERLSSAEALADALTSEPIEAKPRRLGVFALLGVGVLAGAVAVVAATRDHPSPAPTRVGRSKLPPTTLGGGPLPGTWPTSKAALWVPLDPGRARQVSREAAEVYDEDSARALALLGEGIRADPWFSENYVLRAQLRPERERAAAIADLDHACGLGFVRFDKRGELRLKFGQYIAAEAALTIAAALAPSDPQPDYLRARALLQQGFTKRALEALSASILRDPIGAFPLAWIARGRLRTRVLLRAIKRDGDRPRRPDRSQVRDAIRDLNVGLRALPRHGRALHNRAELKLMRGDLDGARADLEAALLAQPPLPATVQAELRRALARLQ